MAPIVILAGFSTAGKSRFLETCGSFAKCIDTDSEIAARSGFGHIYDISMTNGREKALEIISKSEEQVLELLSEPVDKPRLVAAGPFLMTRAGWDAFFNAQKPYVVHLYMNEEAVYNGLMKRREQQKAELDQDNPNFGSWDKDVTTALEDGRYVEVSKEKAFENIRGHLSRATGLYDKYQSCRYDAMELRRNHSLKQELIDLIRSKLA